MLIYWTPQDWANHESQEGSGLRDLVQSYGTDDSVFAFKLKLHSISVVDIIIIFCCLVFQFGTP